MGWWEIVGAAEMRARLRFGPPGWSDLRDGWLEPPYVGCYIFSDASVREAWVRGQGWTVFINNDTAAGARDVTS